MDSDCKDHYWDRSYETKGRFISYWHQLEEVTSFYPRQVLEVGIGNGFVSRYLKERGYNVLTVDRDADMHPDIIASVTVLPLADNCFDVVSCYEVLEHLPYKEFPSALSELRRVSSRYVLLSLPDASSYVRITLQFSGWAATHKLLSHPRIWKRRHRYEGEHFWEIGRRGYSLSRIAGDIRGAGFAIRKTYRVFELATHRFFVLEKE